MSLGSVRQPDEARFKALYDEARRMGLTREAAERAATLGWWGEFYGYRAPSIVSGKRSAEQQKAMQNAWDRGMRSGLVVRPASNSAHTRGEAWDFSRTPHLAGLGSWAHYVGARWGGHFRTKDEVHFDLGAE